MKNKIFAALAFISLFFSGCRNFLDFPEKTNTLPEDITITLKLYQVSDSKTVCYPDITNTGVNYYKISITQNSTTTVYDVAAAESYSLKVKTGTATFQITGYKAREGTEGSYTYSTPVLYYSGDKEITSSDVTIAVYPITTTSYSEPLSTFTGNGNVNVKIKLPSSYDNIQSVSYNIYNSNGSAASNTLSVTSSSTLTESIETEFSIGKYSCLISVLNSNNLYSYYSCDLQVARNLTTTLYYDLSGESFDAAVCTDLSKLELYKSDDTDNQFIDFNKSVTEYDCYGISYQNNYILKVYMGTAAQKISVDIQIEGSSTTTNYDFNNVTGREYKFIDETKDRAQILTIPLNQNAGGWFSDGTSVYTLNISVTKKDKSKLYKIHLHAGTNVTYYAKADGAANGDGTQANPFNTIQKAVDAAVTANKGDGTVYTVVLLSDFTATAASDFNSSYCSYVAIPATSSKPLNLKIKSDGANVYKIDAGGSTVAGVSNTTYGGRVITVVKADSSSAVSLDLNNVQVTGGYLISTNSTDGAGIFIGEYNTVTLSGNTIVGKAISFTDGTQITASEAPAIANCGNYCANRTGGVFISSYATLNMNDSSAVCGNYSGGHAGGIFAGGSGATVNIGSETNHEPAVYGNTADNRGAAVYTYNQAVINLYGRIHHNYATNRSCGVEVTGGTFNMYEGASISDNKGNGSFGGAVHAGNTTTNAANLNLIGKCNLYGGTIKNNLNDYSSSPYQRELHFQNPGFTANIDLSKVVFEDVSKDGLTTDNTSRVFLLYEQGAITLTGAPASGTTWPILMMSYINGDVVLKGSSTCTLTEDLCAQFKASIKDIDITDKFSIKYTAAGGIVDYGATELSGGGITVTGTENITVTVAGYASAPTLSVTKDGSTISTDSYTVDYVKYYNCGTLYDTATATKDAYFYNLTALSSAPPGTYTVEACITCNGFKYTGTSYINVSD